MRNDGADAGDARVDSVLSTPRSNAAVLADCAMIDRMVFNDPS